MIFNQENFTKMTEVCMILLDGYEELEKDPDTGYGTKLWEYAMDKAFELAKDIVKEEGDKNENNSL